MHASPCVCACVYVRVHACIYVSVRASVRATVRRSVRACIRASVRPYVGPSIDRLAMHEVLRSTPCGTDQCHIVMAYIVRAYIVMAYIVMALQISATLFPRCADAATSGCTKLGVLLVSAILAYLLQLHITVLSIRQARALAAHACNLWLHAFGHHAHAGRIVVDRCANGCGPTVMAYIVMAYVIMACVNRCGPTVMAYIVMAYVTMACVNRCGPTVHFRGGPTILAALPWTFQPNDAPPLATCLR